MDQIRQLRFEDFKEEKLEQGYSHWDLTKQFQWAMKVLITVNLKIK